MAADEEAKAKLAAAAAAAAEEEAKNKVKEVKEEKPKSTKKESVKPTLKEKSKVNSSSSKESKVDISIEIPKAIEVKYPDIIPNIEDVEVLELNKNDYYMDKLNNVFQMTVDQDIGIFIGVYNKDSKNIMFIQN